MKKIRFIGDVHGDIPNYVKIANEAEYSIQVGDLAFDYSGMNLNLAIMTITKQTKMENS